MNGTKPFYLSKTLWVNAIMAGLGMAFFDDVALAPDMKMHIALSGILVVNVILRKVTKGAISLTALTLALLLPLTLSITSCKGSDVDKALNSWAFAKPVLSTAASLTAAWCEDGTVASIVPSAANACEEFVEAWPVGMAALDSLDIFVVKMGAVVKHFAKDGGPSEEVRQDVMRRMVAKLPPGYIEDLRVVLREPMVLALEPGESGRVSNATRHSALPQYPTSRKSVRPLRGDLGGFIRRSRSRRASS